MALRALVLPDSRAYAAKRRLMNVLPNPVPMAVLVPICSTHSLVLVPEDSLEYAARPTLMNAPAILVSMEAPALTASMAGPVPVLAVTPA